MALEQLFLKTPSVWDHEAEHWLQSIRRDLAYDYSQPQQSMLNEAYITESSLIRDSELLVEKGAINQQMRTAAIRRFQEEYGRDPIVCRRIKKIHR